MPDEKLKEAKDFGNPDANVVEDVSIDGSTVSITVTIGGKAFMSSKLPIGSEADEPALDGRAAKVKNISNDQGNFSLVIRKHIAPPM